MAYFSHDLWRKGGWDGDDDGGDGGEIRWVCARRSDVTSRFRHQHGSRTQIRWLENKQTINLIYIEKYKYSKHLSHQIQKQNKNFISIICNLL